MRCTRRRPTGPIIGPAEARDPCPRPWRAASSSPPPARLPVALDTQRPAGREPDHASEGDDLQASEPSPARLRTARSTPTMARSSPAPTARATCGRSRCTGPARSSSPTPRPMTACSTTTSIRSSSWAPIRTTLMSPGLVRARPRIPSRRTGTIPFNELIATSGVRSIELNGFVLTGPGLARGGHAVPGSSCSAACGTLSFDSIVAQLDSSITTTPYQIVIGTGNTPLKVPPSIYVNSIQDLVFNSASTTIPTTPHHHADRPVHRSTARSRTSTSPPRRRARSRPASSSSSRRGTTGRTAVQANAVKNLNVPRLGRELHRVARRPAVLLGRQRRGATSNKATFGGTPTASASMSTATSAS